ncbi:MAG: hypothetical protein K9M99_12310 [Candidatus Cloacimonetes bacterium]|nr:hypothetical protein [Candidatus Cloacimonadota bacterium]
MKELRICRIISVFILLILGGRLLSDTDLFKIKTLHGDFDLCAYFSSWSPSLQRIDEDYIDSETIGEMSLDIKGHLEYSGYSVLKLETIIPLKDNPEMKEVMTYNEKKVTGVENFRFFFAVDAIMNKLLADKQWKYFRFFTRFKYSYQRKRYITNAVNDSRFFYIPQEATYNPGSGNINNGIYIEPGTEMQWKSDIIDKELTLFICETDYEEVLRFLKMTITSPIKLKIVPVQLRLGYFICQQSQPASGLYSYNGYPSIMAADFETDGLVIRLETINEEESGLNINWHVKLFSYGEMDTAAYDLYLGEINSDAWCSYLALGFDSWYNFKLSSRALLTLGLNAEVNAFFVYVPNDSDNRDDDEEEEDSIMVWRLRQWPTDFYARFIYRF